MMQDLALLRAHFRNVRRNIYRNLERGGDPHGDIKVVYYNDMFGNPLGLSACRGPKGVRFTGNRLRWRQADAVVFHFAYPLLLQMPGPKPPGQLWVAWTNESEVIYRPLADPGFMALFDIEMTYRQKADVWIPYGFTRDATLAQDLREPKTAPKSPDRLAAAFISSRLDESQRRAYVSELSRFVDVHSYGSVGRNRFLAEDKGFPTKLKIIAGYKFTLAFENSIAVDYVTEKFWHPLLTGSVPVYMGAPNVAEFAPGAHCYIDVRDYASPKALAEYLHYLNSDEDAYQAYHAWRQQPFLPAFEAKQARVCQDGNEIEALGEVVRDRLAGRAAPSPAPR